jgi:beta-lactam-binding protein with PASTA domain
MRFTKLDELVSNNMRFFVLAVAAFLLLAGVAGLAVFFAVLRGDEQVMVPNVQGSELTRALLDLQARELNPRIQLRNSNSQFDRGLVMEQEPAPGSIVKAGRNVRLVVSQGVVLNRVENFVGRNIEDARTDLMSTATGVGGQLLVLREPVMLDYSNDAPGTIIQQNPEAGTEISGPTRIEFVVSQGPQNTFMTVPRLVGLSVSEAFDWLGSQGADFEFSLAEAREARDGETVVGQNPPAGASVTSNTRISLAVAAPTVLKDDEVFGLFRYDMPQNPFPLPVELEAVLPTGEMIPLVGLNFSGGTFTAPYRLPVNSVLILSMLNREIRRETVRPR